MATIPRFQAVYGEMVCPSWQEADARAQEGSYVDDGCLVHQATPASLSIVIDSGNAHYLWAAKTNAGDAIDLTASVDALLPKIVTAYLDTTGAPQVHVGTAATIAPSGESDWKAWEAPYPATATLPAGIPLAKIVLRAGATSIEDADIKSIAAPVQSRSRILATAPVRIVHDGNTAIYTPDADIDILKWYSICQEAGGSRTVQIGTAGDNDMIAASAEIDKTMSGESSGVPNLAARIASGTPIIATFGGSGNGEWDIVLLVVKLT